jgi:hypothetical protein
MTQKFFTDLPDPNKDYAKHALKRVRAFITVRPEMIVNRQVEHA